MKLKTLTLASGIAVSAASPAAAAGTPPTHTPAARAAGPASTEAALAARLDAAIERAIAEQRIVGAVVLVARDGQVVYRRAAGFADREARTPMRQDAIFLLASVTKPFVATAAMRLVEQGRLRLDDPVTRWLPGFQPKGPDGTSPAITLHQLLTHTAGLTYDFLEPADGPYHRLGVSSGLDRPDLSLEENLRRLAAAPLSSPPGTRWGYSMATDVLGAVVARAAGKPLPDAVKELVTAPLGMKDTAFSVVDRRRLATPYGDGEPRPQRMGAEHSVAFNGAQVRFVPGRLLDARAHPSGGAGMAGTADDVLALLEALRGNGGLLRPDTVASMFKAHVGPEAQTQGPGWGFGYAGAVLVDPASARSPQSAGTMQWGGAYGHNWFIDRAKGLTVVALTNTTFEGMTGRFTTDVRDAVYGP
ncbi:serine hydrolase domain-containing protein [Myxococcus sp. RHSTA-1-4]|uniref:serine hydrolase domain-containing protein n=1 Tax=Myxococcus sp. RHSTA-1-4 TaxID=2874601 RepID=UPI001CC04002